MCVPSGRGMSVRTESGIFFDTYMNYVECLLSLRRLETKVFVILLFEFNIALFLILLLDYLCTVVQSEKFHSGTLHFFKNDFNTGKLNHSRVSGFDYVQLKWAALFDFS